MRDLKTIQIFSIVAIANLIISAVFLFIIDKHIQNPKQNTNVGHILPTQTPYIINHTIRVTTTKYIFYRLPEFQTATPIPTRTLTPSPTPTQTPTATPTKVITEFFTNSDPICSLNLRTEPNLSGEIVGKIAQNWIVQVVEVVEGETVRGSNLWCLVEANILYSRDVYVWCKGLKPISKDLLE